ncbi:MAG: hypothetical protein WHT29_12235, partial [Bacteroidales bacterium]
MKFLNKHKGIYIICVAIISSVFYGVTAQNYPIQATLTIAGPYSLTIEDYIAPNDNRLQLNLWLKDINVA